MLELYETKAILTDHDDAMPLNYIGGNIIFKHVTFAYNPRNPILEDFSFEAPARKMTAIVGKTGSGKSTIIKLILRLYEYTSGQILIDG